MEGQNIFCNCLTVCDRLFAALAIDVASGLCVSYNERNSASLVLGRSSHYV